MKKVTDMNDLSRFRAAESDTYGEFVTCASCQKRMGVSLALFAEGERRVARCRVCPANRVFAICEECADLEKINQALCPGCGARNMWQLDAMVPQ